MSTNIFDRPISEIALFPTETEPTVNFDPKRRVKRWADPSPAGVGINAIYAHGLALDEFGWEIRLADGRAALEPIMMPKQEAMSLNIPPQEWEATGTLPAWPVPLDLSKLGPDERIIIQPGSNVPVIRDMRKYEEYQASVTPDDELKAILKITTENNTLLKRIAAKVGA